MDNALFDQIKARANTLKEVYTNIDNSIHDSSGEIKYGPNDGIDALLESIKDLLVPVV